MTAKVMEMMILMTQMMMIANMIEILILIEMMTWSGS